MASIKTKFTVGLFIVVGLVLAIIAIIWLGMSKYLETGHHYVAYFDESVQGLDRDSPVKYRGVPVGRVKSVGVAPDGTLVQVVMKIETDLDSEKEKESIGNVVAQLKSIGITGIMFIELDRKKKGDPEVVPRLTFEPPYPVIATMPSEIRLFFEGVDEVFKQFKAIDGEGLADSAKATFEKIDRAVEDIQSGAVSAEIRSTLSHVNRILAETQVARTAEQIAAIMQSATLLINTARDAVSRFDAILAANEKEADAVAGGVHRLIRNADDTLTQLSRIVSDNKDALSEAVSGFNRSIQDIEALAAQGRRLMDRGDQTIFDLQPRLLMVMQHLERTVENLKNFSENIAAQPSQLLFGRPPEERSVESE